MGLFWVVSELSWTVVVRLGGLFAGPSWGSLWGLLGSLGTILGASGAVVDTVKTRKGNMLNMYVLLKEWRDFCCLLGVFLGGSLAVLGKSGAVLRQS